MARYRKIDVRMYGDERFCALSPPPPNARTLWVYLLTGPHTTSIPGLSSAGEGSLAEALEWPPEGFRKAFAEISAKGMVKADWKARVVWIPKAVAYNPPESPNVITGWRKSWDEIPECALKRQALRLLRGHVDGMSEKFRSAFRKAFPEAFREPFGNQEQEQEQENKEGPTGPSAAGGGGDGPVDPPEPDPAEPATRPADAAKGRRGAKTRVPKPKPADKPEHALTREHWCRAWKTRNGVDYAFNHGRDDGHVKRLLDMLDRDAARAAAVIDAYLADEDPWLVERGHDLGILLSRVNRYRAKRATAAGGMPDPNESLAVDRATLDRALAAAGIDDDPPTGGDA